MNTLVRKDSGDMLCCRKKLPWFREASGFFLELLDLASSSATPESEEMEAVIQDKSEKKF